MDTNGAVSVSGAFLTPNKYRIFLLMLVLVSIPAVSAYSDSYTPVLPNTSTVHINQTYVHDTSPGTPWTLWVGAGVIAALLFLYSLQARTSVAELERDAVVSVLAWIPAAYFAYSSFAVDKLEGAGLVAIPSINGTSTEYTYIAAHTIYHFDVIGILAIAFLLLCVLNTIRIISNYKRFALTLPDQ